MVYILHACLRYAQSVLPCLVTGCSSCVHNPLSWSPSSFPTSTPVSEGYCWTTHLFQLPTLSPNTEKRCHHTIASTSLPLTHFEPAFSTFCRNPNFLSRLMLLTVCIPTTTKAAVLLWWCFSHFSTCLANSAWKDSTFSISACIINQFSHNGHNTSIQYRYPRLAELNHPLCTLEHLHCNL